MVVLLVRPPTLADLMDGQRHQVLVGDVLEQLACLPDRCVQVVICSPPYYQLRRYLGADDPLRAYEMGSEPTVEQFISRLVAVFDEVRRVMRHDGVLAVNIGDSYAGSGKGPSGHNGIGDQERRQGFTGGVPHHAPYGGRQAPEGLKPKDLMLVPERFVLAMQAAGWWVRSRIAWTKRSPMPESVADRPTNAWEPVYLFSKSATYYWDKEGVRQPHAESTLAHQWGPGSKAVGIASDGNSVDVGAARSFRAAEKTRVVDPAGANLRNVWSLSSEPSNYDLCGPCDRFWIGAERKQNAVEVEVVANGKARWRTVGRVCPGCGSADDWVQHFAAFPTALPRLVIQAASSEHGACVACGAPWRRVTRPTAEYQAMLDQNAGQWHGDMTQEAVRGSRDQKRRTNPRLSRSTEHVAWEPTCRCNTAEVEPCVALDMFAGSGSTNVAAEHLGRRSVAIELSPTYAQLIRHRIARDVPRWAKPPKPARAPRRIVTAPAVAQLRLLEGAS